ncbi:MAG: alanine racemase [Alphaproteobacteria bacterium CG_4_9_14_3_um_filter_47_13]|nr:MAG: alanine racemase [Alphaproteobacteria bacterium CG_4_9_14_3_um_filter_47_13]
MKDLSSRKHASAWLRIDLGALAANYNIFKTLALPGCKVAGVIKADGYGLGVDQVFAALETQSCPFYFLATLDEALHIRRLTKKPVAVLGGLYKGAEDIYCHENILPVLNSLEDISNWQKKASTLGIKLPALLHFDTGMNRLGLDAQEAQTLCRDPARISGLDILYLISHFSCADEKNHPATKVQYDKFVKISSFFPAVKKSLANSSGSFRAKEYHFDLLRPGMALYGLNPVPEQENPMKPVVRLDTRILQIRSVIKNETVGYGETYRFDKNTRLATVALGYADGFLRSLGNSTNDRKAVLYYNGIACPVVGRVSMDAVTLDIGHLDPCPVAGETMEVIGAHQTADDLATAAGTIGYEILTSLGSRYFREYC